MLNLERWRYYCKDLCSPNSFIDWGFFSIIGAALQRRVWLGSIRKPLFANIYTIFVAEPGIGKGLVTDQVNKVFKRLNLDKEAQEYTMAVHPPNDGERPLLIPVGADATSYEALVKNLSRSARVFWKDNKKNCYMHSSLFFCLEEVGSLFRKHTEDLVRFLLQTYDCGDYEYDTISRGRNTIRNCCMNILGGVQPSFIRKIFGDEILTDGFASRTIFNYEMSNRFHRLKPPEFNDDQVKEYNVIVKQVKDLSKLYGEVRFEDNSAFLENWWQTEAQFKRANTSLKLLPYYARKNITVQKMAMILHFADSTDMVIPVTRCHEAIEVLEKVEKKMHFALITETRNPISIASDNVIKYITKNGGQSKNELLVEFWHELINGKESMDQILEFLMLSGKVKLKTGKYYIKQEEEET